MDIFKGKSIINQRLKVIIADDVLKNKDYIVLVFCAKRNETLKELIKKLLDLHQECRSRRIKLEIVNIPMDDNLGDMMECFHAQGNWFSLIFQDSMVEELMYMFNVTHIPAIIVVDKSGNIVSRNGYKELMGIGNNVLVTWINS